MSQEVSLLLPWPPSVNHYWRVVKLRTRGGKSYMGRALTPRAIQFRSMVAYRVFLALPITWSQLPLVDVFIQVFPPDARKHDLDNLLKATLDSLTHAGVFKDDSQVKSLCIHDAHILKGAGRLDVLVRQRPEIIT